MEINKRSWHYRYMKEFWNTSHFLMPKNLCSYFWKLVGTIIMSLFLLPFLPILLPIVGIVMGIYKLSDYLLERKGRKMGIKKLSDLPPKQPNFIMAFLKAKKDKVCPLIEYIDE